MITSYFFKLPIILTSFFALLYLPGRTYAGKNNKRKVSATTIKGMQVAPAPLDPVKVAKIIRTFGNKPERALKKLIEEGFNGECDAHIKVAFTAAVLSDNDVFTKFLLEGKPYQNSLSLNKIIEVFIARQCMESSRTSSLTFTVLVNCIATRTTYTELAATSDFQDALPGHIFALLNTPADTNSKAVLLFLLTAVTSDREVALLHATDSSGHTIFACAAKNIAYLPTLFCWADEQSKSNKNLSAAVAQSLTQKNPRTNLNAISLLCTHRECQKAATFLKLCFAYGVKLDAIHIPKSISIVKELSAVELISSGPISISFALLRQQYTEDATITADLFSKLNNERALKIVNEADQHDEQALADTLIRYRQDIAAIPLEEDPLSILQNQQSDTTVMLDQDGQTFLSKAILEGRADIALKILAPDSGISPIVITNMINYRTSIPNNPTIKLGLLDLALKEDQILIAEKILTILIKNMPIELFSEDFDVRIKFFHLLLRHSISLNALHFLSAAADKLALTDDQFSKIMETVTAQEGTVQVWHNGKPKICPTSEAIRWCKADRFYPWLLETSTVNQVDQAPSENTDITEQTDDISCEEEVVPQSSKSVALQRKKSRSTKKPRNKFSQILTNIQEKIDTAVTVCDTALASIQMPDITTIGHNNPFAPLFGFDAAAEQVKKFSQKTCRYQLLESAKDDSIEYVEEDFSWSFGDDYTCALRVATPNRNLRREIEHNLNKVLETREQAFKETLVNNPELYTITPQTLDSGLLRITPNQKSKMSASVSNSIEKLDVLHFIDDKNLISHVLNRGEHEDLNTDKERMRNFFLYGEMIVTKKTNRETIFSQPVRIEVGLRENRNIIGHEFIRPITRIPRGLQEYLS